MSLSEDQQQKLEALRREAAIGLESIENGRGVRVRPEEIGDYLKTLG
ncbi:MAG: hypothetical protein AAF585_06835 [Verrucomicrobiota bacterium]